MTGYQIQAHLSTCLESVRAKKETLGRFILASNQCDHALLNNHAVLQQYKEQSCVESSFKFIKNNAFELDSFFLKTPRRITALMMVMTLCLMVYNFAQAHLRQCLKEHDEVLPNQLGKPVTNPTMKWIAELMNPIAVVTIITNNPKQASVIVSSDTSEPSPLATGFSLPRAYRSAGSRETMTPIHKHRIVTNVKTVHQRIIAYFGKHALEIYGLPETLSRVPINYNNYKNLLHWCET